MLLNCQNILHKWNCYNCFSFYRMRRRREILKTTLQVEEAGQKTHKHLLTALPWQRDDGHTCNVITRVHEACMSLSELTSEIQAWPLRVHANISGVHSVPGIMVLDPSLCSQGVPARQISATFPFVQVPLPVNLNAVWTVNSSQETL